MRGRGGQAEDEVVDGWASGNKEGPSGLLTITVFNLSVSDK